MNPNEKAAMERVCPFLAQAWVSRGNAMKVIRTEAEKVETTAGKATISRFEVILDADRLPTCIGSKCMAYLGGDCRLLRELPL